MQSIGAPDRSIWIGMLRPRLNAPLAHPKKDKRKQIHRLHDRFRLRRHLSVSEFGYLENPKRSVIGAVMIFNEQALLQSSLQSLALEVQMLIDRIIESTNIHIQPPYNRPSLSSLTSQNLRP